MKLALPFLSCLLASHLEAASSRDDLDASSSINVINDRTNHQRETESRKHIHPNLDDGGITNSITNDSETFREVITINPFKVTLKSTDAQTMSEAETNILIESMESILTADINAFSKLNIVSAIFELDIAAEVDFIPATRMLRNGRYLADGASTAAYSIVKIAGGGTADVAVSINDDAPTEEELNDVVLEIWNANLFKDMLMLEGFEQLNEVIVEPYEPEGKNIAVATSASLGAMVAAIIAAIIAAALIAAGAAYYCARKRSLKKASSNDREVRSNWKKDTKKANAHDDAQDKTNGDVKPNAGSGDVGNNASTA